VFETVAMLLVLLVRSFQFSRTAGPDGEKKNPPGLRRVAKKSFALSRSRNPPARGDALGRNNRPYNSAPTRCVQRLVRIQHGRFHEHVRGHSRKLRELSMARWHDSMISPHVRPADSPMRIPGLYPIGIRAATH
jgi:hypothetical protein